jgi:hypothetical protein
MLMSSKLLRLHTGLNFQHFLSVSPPPLLLQKESSRASLCIYSPKIYSLQGSGIL